MREWIAQNSEVDGEDLERHDKWLCMMWPRLQLLKELLAEDGVIFASIDDHEQWRLLGLMEEVFGDTNFIATLSFVQNLGARPGKWISQVTEYVHIFAKDIEKVDFAMLPTDEDPGTDWEQDDLGYYREGYALIRTGTGSFREDRPDLYFPIYIGTDLSIGLERSSPDDTEILPVHPNGVDARWMWSKERIQNSLDDLLVKPHKRAGFQIITKVRPNIGDTFSRKPRSLWYKPEYTASNGTNVIKDIFNGERIFDFPKSVPFVADIIRFANVGPDDIVLDSFAGSGTTAHAVLALNKEDGGNRKFILVECEDYADTTTAERVRRVIRGVPDARDKSLRDGLGGSFTYCTLGQPIELEAMLSGSALPSYSALAAYLLHASSGISAGGDELQARNDDGLFYSSREMDYCLLYEPDIEWLCGGRGMLSADRARRIGGTARASGRKAVVFGPGKYIGQRDLTNMGVTFCQIPYELHAAG